MAKKSNKYSSSLIVPEDQLNVLMETLNASAASPSRNKWSNFGSLSIQQGHFVYSSKSVISFLELSIVLHP